MALINIDGDPWLSDLDACERLSNEIQSQLVARNREGQLSRQYSSISGQVRVRLKQFGSELEQLNKKLSYISSSLTSAEAERRQRLVEGLQSKLVQLQRQFSSVEASAERASLFASGSSRLFDDDDDDPALIRPESSYTVADLRAQQTRILEDQNEGLDALSKVISRQKELASRIGGEVDRHNDILDDLATTMETTDARLDRETRQIGVVTVQDSTWGYWTIIGILAAAIIIVAILP
ncbi:syntaxin-8 [Culex quinquefasciatus]|uniref:Syntaxin-8 n=3 Tax=Culex pipiens complex TaxID=518105 RepID=B0WXL9_CULQU|nr:syntaxin-8 [Culex quinquefasciatus]XP_039451194.1 syntaxin-8 [Culex pipiens pallens]EDS36549.1 syntaxin-8 [Culex quinquefasciatus]|eukprot:XP_001862141.1 syntaxin-8 [Culex quinquefasciatus]